MVNIGADVWVFNDEQATERWVFGEKTLSKQQLHCVLFLSRVRSVVVPADAADSWYQMMKIKKKRSSVDSSAMCVQNLEFLLMLFFFLFFFLLQMKGHVAPKGP